jgi:hypothetical protein
MRFRRVVKKGSSYLIDTSGGRILLVYMHEQGGSPVS